MARSLRDHFTTLMKRYKSETKREVKGDEQRMKRSLKKSDFLKTLQTGLKKVNVEPDTQKRQSDIEKEKEKAQEMRKKTMGRFGGTRIRKEQDENDTGDKNKVEDVVQKLLVFFVKTRL